MRRRSYAARDAEAADQAAALAAFYADDSPGALLIDESDAKPTCCGLCKQAATTDDYCNGCKTVVCQGCEHPDVDQRPTGKHKPEAHLPRAKVIS